MESQLTTLNREIAQLETEAARLGIDRSAIAKAAAKIARRHHYLRIARSFRAPRASFPLWPLAVFTIGPLLTGFLVLIVVNLLFDSGTLALIGFFTGALVGAAMFALILYHPADSLLAAAIPEAEAKWRVDKARLEQILGELTAVNEKLQSLLAQRKDLVATDKLQRAMLLQRNWKTMRAAEWEDFIVEVCRTLGANVQRIENVPDAARAQVQPATGPRGVAPRVPHTLIVTFSPRRIAVAAVTGISPFHTAAVQQTVNDLAGHGCDSLGIITNSRLTAGGKELAKSRNCTLIGEEEFPDFVLGKISL